MTTLNLSEKGLREISAKVISPQRASGITTLDLTSNQIVSGKNFNWFTNMHTLILDKNGMTSFTDFPELPSVKTLWLNNNNFDSLVELMDDIVRIFPNIDYISTLFNPVAPNMYSGAATDVESYNRYRYYVLYRCKKLSFLDALQVDKEERDEAERVGERMAPRRPQPSTSIKKAEVSEQETIAQEVKPAAGVKEPQTAAFLAKGKPRYDGSNSEGNRFILNDDL